MCTIGTIPCTWGEALVDLCLVSDPPCSSAVGLTVDGTSHMLASVSGRFPYHP